MMKERRSADPLARIETARHELGRTAVAPATARGLVIAFLAATAAAPLAQLAVEPEWFAEARRAFRPPAAGPSAAGSATAAVIAGNRRLLASIRRVEDLAADDALAARTLRPAAQSVLSALGAGAAQVVQGTKGWLFYAPDVAYVTGPGFLDPQQLRRAASGGDTVTAARRPDPRPALFDLRGQLARRGIALIVMPTPVKPALDGERLAGGGGRGAARVAGNASYRAFVDELRSRGVPVFDVLDSLRGRKRGTRRPLYLATDTHWRPETMEFAADRLAAFIAREVEIPDAPAPAYRIAERSVTNRGDTERLLGLSAGGSAYRPETVTVRQVASGNGRLWRPDRSADVLLLGDSFTNVFSLGAMGWGSAAGLAEHLSVALRRPIDRLAQNDDGARASRELLAAALGRGDDRLAGKRVVVFQFAARELGQGDWRLVDLGQAPRPRPTTFLRPTPGARLEIRGAVRAVGPVPRPGSVPYRDHVVGVHVAGVTVESGGAAVDGGEALVYLRSMRDNAWTDAARYRIGDAVRLRVRPWGDVAGELDGINRGEVDNPSTRLAEPWWGEPIR